MKITLAALTFASVCPTALPQAPDACRADLQHLTLPHTAQIADGNGETPIQFLFSDHGADVYSVIPSSEPNGIVWFISNGIRIIIVFQDEQARQQAIHNLMQPGVVADVMAGSSPHGTLDKLKFAVVHLGAGSSKDKPDEGYARANHSSQEVYLHELLTSGWHIEGIAYFEPESCVPRKHELCLNKTGQMVPCVSHSLHASDSDPNWITDLSINPFKRKPEPDDPQFLRIVETMKGRLKEFEERDKTKPIPLETRMGSSEVGPLEAAATKIVETYSPCIEATRPLQVPEGIHSALPGQTFSFMFSQDGIDAYAIRYGAPPKYQGVLLVFQDEQIRRAYLKSFISDGSVSWYPLDSTKSHQDWKPIMSFKYATFVYGWLGDTPMLSGATFYAPRECYSRRTSVGALTRNELGVYMKSSGDRLDSRNGVLHRAAVELKKLETQKQKP